MTVSKSARGPYDPHRDPAGRRGRSTDFTPLTRHFLLIMTDNSHHVTVAPPVATFGIFNQRQSVNKARTRRGQKSRQPHAKNVGMCISMLTVYDHLTVLHTDQLQSVKYLRNALPARSRQ